MRARRARVAVLLATALAIVLPSAAYATAGDLYAAGTVYGASTYNRHTSVFGAAPDAWVVDINAAEGDQGRPLYAPEAGMVEVFSTGYGSGWGNSVIWTSADGREKLHLAHLDGFGVTGAVVGGELIGYAGNTGKSTSDHLHVSRTYDGAAAPLVLSGHEIVPGYSGNGNRYVSAGAVRAQVSLSGVVDGMTYYAPVTITYDCAGADPGTLVAQLDGAPLASGTQVAALGTHRLTVTVSVRGTVVTSSATFTISIPPTPGLQPVFRFFNPSKGTHFFTQSAAERDLVMATWSGVFAYEGVAYWLDPSKNAQPLYRFYNLRNSSHFYTASAAERDTVIDRWPAVYAYEGEAYRVSAEPVAGATTVYRFYNADNGSHFFTASDEERDVVIAKWSNVYTFEGVAFWLVR